MAGNISAKFMASSGLDWPRFFATSLSSIWRTKNELVFSDTPHTPSRIWGFIRSLGMEDFVVEATLGPSLNTVQCQPINCFTGRREGSRIARWAKPPAGCLKVNVDGALIATCEPAVGPGVLRDETGAWQ